MKAMEFTAFDLYTVFGCILSDANGIFAKVCVPYGIVSSYIVHHRWHVFDRSIFAWDNPILSLYKVYERVVEDTSVYVVIVGILCVVHRHFYTDLSFVQVP